jgi:hypothetical protein
LDVGDHPAQPYSLPIGAYHAPEDEYMETLREYKANEDGHPRSLASDDPSEEALGHVQRLIYSQNNGGAMVDNHACEFQIFEVEALLAKSSTLEFARLLFDAECSRCMAAVHGKVPAETFVNAVGGQLTESCRPRLLQWTNNDNDFPRELVNGSQESSTWALDDQYRGHQNEAECRAVIENLFFDSIPRQHVVIHAIESVANLGLAGRFVKRVKDDNAHVGVTFHGAQPEHVEHLLREGILPQNMDMRVGAHAGVAHLHAEADQRGRRIICVLLTAISQNAGEHQRQPGQGGEVNVLDKLVSQTHYGVVDEDRSLVSHLICYGVRGGRRRVGGGFDDPFLRRLSSAVQRASSAATAAVRGARSNSCRPRPRRGHQ